MCEYASERMNDREREIELLCAALKMFFQMNYKL